MTKLASEPPPTATATVTAAAAATVVASLQITTTKHNSWSAKNPFDLLKNISFRFV